MLSALTLFYYVYLQQITGVVTLHVVSFDIEDKKTNVCRDYLTIYDGPDPSPSQEIGKYCGSSLPPDLHRTVGSILLFFHTDVIDVGNGFKVSWGKLTCLF